MSRITKWKLAIVAGISECLIYAEAKYCAFERNREPQYYKCPRTEYCCNFGCCVSPGFQIYHLWYYWLLVIIMFLVCSGGGWWYRYWLQGRYRAAASAIPTRSSSSRTQNPLRGPTCQAQQARITYNTARNTVLLHRMWKAQRSASSPAYSAAGAASSTAHYQNTSVVLNDANCPYYQLYGPPPSYETVIAQTRGKISTPSSPELLQRQHPDYAGQCFYPSLLPPPPLEAPQYQARLEGFDTAEYARLLQRYNGSGLSPRHQLYQPQYVEARPSDNSDADVSPVGLAQTGDTPTDDASFLVNCPANRRLFGYALADGKLAPRVGVHGMSRREYPSLNSPLELVLEPVATTSSSLQGFESCSSSHRSSRSELRKLQGGSLKIPRKRDHQAKQQYDQGNRVSRRLSSADCEASTSRESETRRQQQQQQQPEPQPSPSSHVILAANATSKISVVEDAADDQRSDHHRHDHLVHHQLDHSQQQQQQQPPATATIAERSSTNSNLESKRKLDRSRSLD